MAYFRPQGIHTYFCMSYMYTCTVYYTFFKKLIILQHPKQGQVWDTPSCHRMHVLLYELLHPTQFALLRAVYRFSGLDNKPELPSYSLQIRTTVAVPTPQAAKVRLTIWSTVTQYRLLLLFLFLKELSN